MDFNTFGFEKVSETVKESKSLTEVCLKLGISTGGTHTNALKLYILENNIDNSHFKNQNRVTRQEYEANPKYCLHCGAIIPFDKRINKFCNASCAASYNNTHVLKVYNPDNYINKFDNFNDDEFIKILNNNLGWDAISKAFGYKNVINGEIKLKIKDRADKLNVKISIKNSEVDWNKVTKGLLFENRSNWQSARSTIRKLAAKNYNNSGKEYKCAVCGYDKHIEIAHIKAVADFDDSTSITEINDINNLIGLCPNHHWEYDSGLLDISEYIKK